MVAVPSLTLMKKSTLLLFVAPLALLASCKFLFNQLVDYKDLWPSGLDKARGSLMGGKQSGEWVLSYESGQPLAKGTYKNDRQVGDWVFYYENGSEKRSGSYDENGLRTGEWTYTYEDSTPQSKGSYYQDSEDGLWKFYGTDGAVIRAGQFDAGKQSGLWRFNYAAGKPRAEGFYHAGSRIGPWQVWDENGGSRMQDFGTKAGIQVVRQVWPGTSDLQRVGVLENGQPAGRWTSYHPNGKLRFCCGMASGTPNGSFEAHGEDGSVLAQGRFEGGMITGGVCVENGVSRIMAPGALPSSPNDVATWSDMAAVASASPEAAVAMLVAEHKSAVGSTPYVAVTLTESEQSPSKPAPVAAAIIGAIDDEPTREPAAAQPGLTVDNRKKLAKIVDRYENGEKASNSTGDVYAPTPGGPRPRFGTGRRTILEGKKLPFDVMKGVDGNDVDLRSYIGKQRVMIVVLRGFLGEVCVYCVAQTKALAKARAKLEAANVEVLVIYPGVKENEASFRMLYEEEFGEGPPPYRVFYDEDLDLVTKLGIEGDLASPTTLIIDEAGIVQYAYVGEHRADRPATTTLIKLIEGM
jgi:antitoxin component YwqK of YwqJK toxin-antitoxin module/peroxiredoxin